MKIDIKLKQVCQTHRTGRLKIYDDNNKPRPIIVKFVRHIKRNKIFSDKKTFK